MRVTPQKGRRAGVLPAITPLRVLLAVAGLLALAAISVVLLRPDIVQSALRSVEQRWGYAFRQADPVLAEQWAIAAGNLLRQSLDGVPDIPDLVLDVPFDGMRMIYAKREEALERGILVQGEDDFVRGKMRFGGETIPVELRLKGDWNDHLTGRKWSFRVHIRNDQHLFGMRRFSLQNPNTRGFQSEDMFFQVLQRYNVMAPRYYFVNLTLNGDALGVMAVEEFFAKELLESRQRREGVIVRFNEALAWSAKDAISGEAVGWGGAFDNYRNAPIDAIGSGRVARSPVLSKQYRVAEGLLRGFAEGRLSASEVFDTEQLGAFLATADLFGAWHTTVWHNLRFYLNPVSLKLEPIAFDVTLQERLADTTSITQKSRIAVDMLRDPQVWSRYKKVLRDLQQALLDGSLQADLRAVEARHLPVLQTEFRMLGRFPLDYLQPRAEALLDRADAAGDSIPNPDEQYFLEREADQYPVLAHLGILTGADGQRLRIDSAVPKDVRITAVEWVEIAGERRIPAVESGQLPLQVPARGIGAAGTRHELELVPVPFAMGDASGWQLEVRMGLQGRNWDKSFTPVRVYEALKSEPLPQPDLEELLRDFRFLSYDAAADRVVIQRGNWAVTRTLSLPPGTGLQVVAGTRLEFAADAILLVRGPLEVTGTAAEPVELVPQQDATWPGLVVMNAAERSRLQHVIVRDTHSVTTPLWTLTGGINFYASDVSIADSQLLGSHGEDALNIIHADFSLSNITVRNTASDAFDADFATGRVSGGLFADIGYAGGGDAIDISGSQVEVDGTRFEDVSDKALSVGEGSRMQATQVSILRAATGAAAKDGSLLELTDSAIDTTEFAALTAYMKKPEYGGAEITARSVQINSARREAIAQTGSRIVLDGTEVVTEDVDVDTLYSTIMRPGLRR